MHFSFDLFLFALDMLYVGYIGCHEGLEMIVGLQLLQEYWTVSLVSIDDMTKKGLDRQLEIKEI